MDNSRDNFITVLTVVYPHELIVIQARLESEGIECNVKDELTAQVNPFYSNAIGGVKLQVKESDFQKALELINENPTSNENTPEPIKLSNNEQGLKCPSYGSDEVSKPRFSTQAFAISFLLLGFPIPFLSKICHCFNCGMDFKKGKIKN